MTSGLDEVDASVDPIVDNIDPVDPILGIQVGIEALVDIVHDRTPGLIIVDEIAKAWRVHHGQPKSDPILLDVSTDRLDGDRLWYYVMAGTRSFFGRI